MKEFSGIIAFEKVASLGSFSKAAEELGVSKSYISKLIQELEDEMKQRLLHRSTRTVKLTSSGEIYYEKCLSSLQQIRQAKQEILNLQTQPKGHLRISLAGAFGEYYIAPLIADFMKRYPEVSIELSFSGKIVDLLKEGFDIAIRVGQLKNSNLTAKKIASRKLYTCATPAYFHKHGQPLTIKELELHRCIVGTNDRWKFHKNGKPLVFKPQANLKANNGRAVLNATLKGLGICQLPGVYINSYLKSGILVPILDQFSLNEIPIWAITAGKKNRSAAINTLLRELETAFQDTLY